MTDTPHGGENLEVMQDAHKYNAFLRSLIRKHAGDVDNAVDFGSGIGTFSDSLEIDTRQITCVETEPSSLAVLETKGFRTARDLGEIDDDSVSYLFSLNVLEHIEDDAQIAREMYRVLKPGGHLFIYVPAFQVLFTSMDAHVGHVRRYRRPALVSLFADAGFNVHYSAYTDALGFFASLAYRWLDNGEPKPLNTGAIRLYDRWVFPLSRMLSTPLAKVLGKNVMLAGRKPE
ncbi:MAG: methyltransferase domain-containing protein [Pseudomonadota bacterium]